MNLPPSIFLTFPWDSVAGNSERESTAYYIMVVRAQRGDKWPLTYRDYKTTRVKMGGDPCDATQFREVMKLIPDAIGAVRFCDAWAERARKALKTS